MQGISSMSVSTITSREQYDTILSTSEATKLVIVQFTATWCGPCQTIKPFVEKFSETYPHVTFVKVDVDEFEKLADDAEVTAMPTFQFHRANRKIAELKGDEAPELKALIEKYQTLAEE
ncbi:hypothetical protein KVV02_008684 [Mortierella alpina]|uniref:Thioredoxin domain-containing protein n=1 Tax=Mortierella alpina TaxID=64518 RepID=A0A9P7ZZZ2_MORAP|nr:hypothetical protein KVV02_008684 [Mortierella alpina]